MWDFSTEPEFQAKLDWVENLMREEIEPLDLVYPDGAFEEKDPRVLRYVDTLKARVREQGLWACHLGPELGGQGYGQLKLTLLNEILGRSQGEHNLGWGPIAFGTQAPDTGNAEIIAHYGTAEQKAEYLQPLLNGELFSAFAMTEPQGGADPGGFTTSAVRDGDSWVINGEKYFVSNARYATFYIVMAITNPGVSVHRGSSMFLAPADTPGIEILRNVNTGVGDPANGTHAYMRFTDVRVPADHLLGPEGSGFEIAQTRLSGGRLHHAMRTIAQARQALDMMCERVLSRTTKGSLLSEKQFAQGAISDSYIELEQFRLFVLRTAWLIDQKGYLAARKDVAACKVQAAKVLQDVVGRSMHLHGALGVSADLPLHRMWRQAPWMGVHDGPTEVHQTTVVRQLLRDYEPHPGLWPRMHLPQRLADAQVTVAAAIERAEVEAAAVTG